MANFLKQHTIGNKKIFNMEEIPTLTGGLAAVEGSIALVKDANDNDEGKMFLKFGPNDIDWKEVMTAEISATVNTTDATETLIYNADLNTDSGLLLEVEALARRTGGASATGAIGDVAGFKSLAIFKNVADACSIIGEQASYHMVDDASCANFDLNLEVNDASDEYEVKVKGDVDMNVSWKVKVKFQSI